MYEQTIFIIFICICWFIVFYTFTYEKFNSNSYLNSDSNSDSNINSYFKPLKNIFLGDNYYNYQLNHPNQTNNTQSLNEISFDSFIYSKPITQKIICSSHTNRGDCWEDNVNNCQWIHKIDSKSYCDVAPIWLL